MVALGKLGAGEMTFESDLDLLFVADLPDDREQMTGPAPIEAQRFYGRVAQHLIAALRSRSASGRLYEVDMRLRPCGDSGPLVTTLDAFREYHASAAWTWERMSLTRARVVCGDAVTTEAVAGEISGILTRSRNPERLLEDVARMRDRVAAEYPRQDPFELKYARGGLVDLEFIAQYLQLLHAHESPEVLAGGTAACFEALAGAGVLPEEEARFLAAAVRMQRTIQALLRPDVEPGTPGARGPGTAAQEAGSRPGVRGLRGTGGEAPRHPRQGVRAVPALHRSACGGCGGAGARVTSCPARRQGGVAVLTGIAFRAAGNRPTGKPGAARPRGIAVSRGRRTIIDAGSADPAK